MFDVNKPGYFELKNLREEYDKNKEIQIKTQRDEGEIILLAENQTLLKEVRSKL